MTLTILRMRSEDLGDRWDIQYHRAPTINIVEPAFSLGEIATIRRGYSARTEEYVTEEEKRKKVPYIRISDIHSRSVSGRSIKYILDKENIPGKARVETNEILFSITGTLGKVGLVSAAFEKAVASSQIAIIRARERYVNSEFLVRALEARYVKEQISRTQTGSFIKDLSLDQLKRLRVSVPDKVTQSAILLKLRALESEYEASKQTQDKVKHQIDSIFGGA